MSRLIEVVKNDDKEESEYLKKFILDSKIELSQELRAVGLLVLIRNLSKRIKSGDLSSARELYGLYNYGFENHILWVNKRLPGARFLNYINVASVCKEFDHSEKFIIENQSRLEDKYRKELVAIAHAQLAFNKNSYEECLFVLSRIKSAVPFNYANRMRWLILCSNYKVYSSDLDYMLGVIRNYNTYFSNHKDRISRSNLLASLNLSKMIKYMLEGRDSDEMKIIISNCQELVFRIWIVQQLK